MRGTGIEGRWILDINFEMPIDHPDEIVSSWLVEVEFRVERVYIGDSSTYRWY